VSSSRIDVGDFSFNNPHNAEKIDAKISRIAGPRRISAVAVIEEE
jgi:hypothetical protein